MSFVATDDWQRYGRQIDADMTVVDDSVDKLLPLGMSGEFWQGWKGFYGGWTQYYQEDVKPTPVLPWHDDSPLTEYAQKLDVWKSEVKSLQDQFLKTKKIAVPIAPTALLSTTSTQAQSDTGANTGTSRSTSWLVPVGATFVGLFLIGYVLSSGAKLRSAF